MKKKRKRSRWIRHDEQSNSTVAEVTCSDRDSNLTGPTSHVDRMLPLHGKSKTRKEMEKKTDSMLQKGEVTDNTNIDKRDTSRLR